MNGSEDAPVAGRDVATSHQISPANRWRFWGPAARPLVLLVLLVSSFFGNGAAEALSLGTWSVEQFTLRGKDRYVSEDVAHIARVLLHSQAAVVALQDIEGAAPLRSLTLHHLPGWRYAGNDTRGHQDLFFLWDTRRVGLLWGPKPYLAAASFCWREKNLRLFDRPPLVAVFLDTESGCTMTLVNIHLKGCSPRDKDEGDRSLSYDSAKRGAQIQRLNDLVGTLRGLVFILGDYNADPILGTSFPVRTLAEGFSCDGAERNFDAVGYQGISPSPAWRVFDVEGAVPRRSSKRQEHPERDLVVLDLGTLPPVSADTSGR